MLFDDFFFTWSVSTSLPINDCEEFYPVTSVSNTVQERIILQGCGMSKVFWKGNNKLKLLLQEILKQIKFVDCLLPSSSESFIFVYSVWRCMSVMFMYSVWRWMSVMFMYSVWRCMSVMFVYSVWRWMYVVFMYTVWRCMSVMFMYAVWRCTCALWMFRIFHVCVCFLKMYECSVGVQHFSCLYDGSIVVVVGRGGIVEQLLASECGLFSMALMWKVTSTM